MQTETPEERDREPFTDPNQAPLCYVGKDMPLVCQIMYAENYCLHPILVNQLRQKGIIPLAVQVVLREVPIVGRLAQFQQNWVVVTHDPWVLNTIQGFQIEFHSRPVQESCPHVPHQSLQQEELMSQEVESMLEKGAIEKESDHLWISLQHFSSTRGSETCDHPEMPQWLRREPPLQDRGHSRPLRQRDYMT